MSEFGSTTDDWRAEVERLTKESDDWQRRAIKAHATYLHAQDEVERLRAENETLKTMLYTWVTPVELAEALEGSE